MGKPVVTVSRQHGSGGEQVAALVAERLGVPLLDQEIRQRAAERAGVGERTMLDAERPVGFVTRMLERMGSAGFMLDNGGAVAASQFPVPSLESYRETLGQVVREAAAGGAVIVGSAAHLTLRDYPGVVRVLVQAPIEARIVRLVEEEGLSPAEARRQAETEDRERVRFYQESYRVNWYDSRLYDCIVDTHRLGVDGAAAAVLAIVTRTGSLSSHVALPQTPRQASPATVVAAAIADRRSEGEIVALKAGKVCLRPMGTGDGPKLFELFRTLPPGDLLFLRRNVTDPLEIEAWEREVADGRMLTLLAETLPGGGASPTVVGEASLRRSEVPWTSHVGEIRAITAPSYRGSGLGTTLLRAVLDAARSAGIEKVTAEAMAEQEGARRTLRRLGFVEQGRYAGYARDLEGNAHDLVVMTYTSPGKQ